MHPLTRFFTRKSSLHEQAKKAGKPCALPSEVLPHLAKALHKALVDKAPPFTGSPEESEYLLNAARNMAIFAVWENKPAWLSSGTLALLFENGVTDGRLTMIHLAMLNHASQKLSTDFSTISQPLADQVDSETSSWITAFNARSNEGKSLESFGFKEVVRGGKFDFKCTW